MDLKELNKLFVAMGGDQEFAKKLDEIASSPLYAEFLQYEKDRKNGKKDPIYGDLRELLDRAKKAGVAPPLITYMLEDMINSPLYPDYLQWIKNPLSRHCLRIPQSKREIFRGTREAAIQVSAMIDAYERKI